ncbi:MAG: YvcK family protein [Candidatus Omnitrophica bacterium]|nr:YvcK family protein [Candidatus Omnitrophota bacterium]
MGIYKWLYPGMRIKRWMVLCSIGIVLCSMGFVVTLIENQEASGSLFVVAGIFLVVLSIRKIMKSVIMILAPNQEGQILNKMYQRGVLSSGPRIVAVGGGTGLSVLLRGLKERTTNITAVVTVSDDGGSSGRLRSQFDVLPPGDIRNCLSALADAEPMMQELLQFRFSEKSSDLAGHSFGNLFILAMAKITGDFEKAVRESSRILNIRGQVVPSTLSKVVLEARHADGKVLEGETKISAYASPIERLFLKPDDSPATDDAIAAIRTADAIVLGPGSLYTSVLPNLLIKEILQEIARVRVPKIYVCNIMTQPHETAHLKSDIDHVRALVEHTRPEVITHCIVNNGAVPGELAQRYTGGGSVPLECRAEEIRQMGYTVFETDLVQGSDVVRHNSRKLSKLIVEIAQSKK